MFQHYKICSGTNFLTKCGISSGTKITEINENVLLEPISQKISTVLAWGTFAIEGMTVG